MIKVALFVKLQAKLGKERLSLTFLKAGSCLRIRKLLRRSGSLDSWAHQLLASSMPFPMRRDVMHI